MKKKIEKNTKKTVTTKTPKKSSTGPTSAKVKKLGSELAKINKDIAKLQKRLDKIATIVEGE